MLTVDARDPYGLVGQVLDGQFRVDRFVGEGGFSAVYRGTHVGLSEPIAIKCLKLPMALGTALVESFIRRFRDESRLHYKLSQGNLHIVRSIASGTTMSPTTSALVPYTVLEWLDGHAMADELTDRRARGATGRPHAEVVRVFDTALDARAYAHTPGVVHRDHNPRNFFLAETPAGPKLKVLDFGVAKVLADSALAMGPSQRTLGNVRMFAPAYGAPEQFDDRLGAIGPWTDVYALCLVLLEAMSDRGVVEGEHLGEFAAKALDENNRPSPRSLGMPVGDAVQDLFVRGLALRPGDRPGDAGELWGMLKHAMRKDAEPGKVAHASQPPRGGRAPATLRMEQVVPASLPAIELDRPGGLSVPSAASHGHQLGGTLRIPKPAGRSGAEALGATPGVAPPPPTHAHALAATLPIPTPLPTAAVAPGPPRLTPGFTSSEAPSGERREQRELRPSDPARSVPKSDAPSASSRSIALTVVFSVVGALAVVAALWLAMVHFGK